VASRHGFEPASPLPTAFASAAALSVARDEHVEREEPFPHTRSSTFVPELSGKQFALLSEIVPGLARVAIFRDSGEAGDAQSVAEAERAAARLHIQSQSLDLREVGDPAQLFAAAARGRASAVLVLAAG
jgi:hypothetical protein